MPGSTQGRLSVKFANYPQGPTVELDPTVLERYRQELQKTIKQFKSVDTQAADPATGYQIGLTAQTVDISTVFVGPQLGLYLRIAESATEQALGLDLPNAYAKFDEIESALP